MAFFRGHLEVYSLAEYEARNQASAENTDEMVETFVGLGSGRARCMHYSVMLAETLEYLAVKADGVVHRCDSGHGGHTRRSRVC